MQPKPAVKNNAILQPKGNLGKLLASYRGHPIRKSEILIFFLLTIGAVVGPLGYGIWRLLYGYTHYGPASAISWSQPWFIASASATLLIILLLIRRIGIARLRIHVHKNGITINRPLRKRNREIMWGDIASISSSSVQERFLGMVFTNTNKLSLTLQNRKRHIIDGDLQGLSQLSDRIKSMIYPTLLKQYRGKINTGQHVSFEKIHLSNNGLHFHNKDYHWNSILNIGIHSGSLVIELTNAKIQKFAVSSIPNVEILLQLVEDLTQH